MPAAADHYRFARARLAARSESGSRGADVAREPLPLSPDMVLIGTQGPDPFYFYGLVPWRPRPGRGRVAAFADFLHGADPLDFFPVLADRAAAMDSALGGAGRDAAGRAVSFTYGLLLHYLLDRSLHPYVYYRTGFDAKGETKGIFGVDHGFFETGMGESGRGSESEESTSPGRLFAADADDLSAAGALFAAAFPERILSEDYAASWRDMRTVLGVLWDPTLVKRKVLDALGLHDTRPRSMMRPIRDPARDGIDYLNEAKTPWRHPVDGTDSDASVRELTARAASDAAEAEALLSAAAAGGAADWAELFRGINHEGNRPGETMRCYRSAYRAPQS